MLLALCLGGRGGGTAPLGAAAGRPGFGGRGGGVVVDIKKRERESQSLCFLKKEKEGKKTTAIEFP